MEGEVSAMAAFLGQLTEAFTEILTCVTATATTIFMLIWDNSPTQVIVLSLMVGLCLLILGRGPRVAGEVRRHEERASRRKKGG